MISGKVYNEIKNWIYRNARDIELSLWKYYFENGSNIEVVNALAYYQNEDGGFGNILEPDNWNPNSTPYTTLSAINILKNINFEDASHPVFKKILNYLYREKDLTEYGWRFCIATNDDFPHAPWWNYSEETNLTESLGVTTGISAFVLKYGDPSSLLYQKVKTLVDSALEYLMAQTHFGDVGVEGYIELIDVIKSLSLGNYSYLELQTRMNQIIKESIEHDTAKWGYYTVRPSNYIKSPVSIYYDNNKDIVKKELEYLIETLPQNDVWGITWTWHDNYEKYEKEFAVSENWWKANKAIEKLYFLKNFGYIEI